MSPPINKLDNYYKTIGSHIDQTQYDFLYCYISTLFDENTEFYICKNLESLSSCRYIHFVSTGYPSTLPLNPNDKIIKFKDRMYIYIGMEYMVCISIYNIESIKFANLYNSYNDFGWMLSSIVNTHTYKLMSNGLFYVHRIKKKATYILLSADIDEIFKIVKLPIPYNFKSYDNIFDYLHQSPLFGTSLFNGGGMSHNDLKVYRTMSMNRPFNKWVKRGDRREKPSYMLNDIMRDIIQYEIDKINEINEKGRLLKSKFNGNI